MWRSAARSLRSHERCTVRFVVALAVLLLGCSAPNAPAGPASPHLVVSELEYTVRGDSQMYRAEIPFRYTNRTADTLVISECRAPAPPRLEWWTGSEWRPAFEHVWLACGPSAFVIPPATVIEDTLRLDVPRDSIGPGGSHLRPSWQASHRVGEYRLVWPLQNQGSPAERSEGRGGGLRPLAERVSNTFRLRITSP
jgi:hypothetical protein